LILTAAANAFGIGPAPPSRARRNLAFFGGLSLEIFLLHQPLIRDHGAYVLVRFLPSSGTTTPVLLIVIAVGRALAIAFSLALERCLRPLNRLLARPSGARSA
jgi:peptidoglycan/LPS O-acetylase OafA/YrhL